MADELKRCKHCGCDWGHMADCPLDAPLAVENSRLKAENAALRAEVVALKGGVEEVVINEITYRTNASSTNAKLIGEIAALKAENQKMHHDWMADHAELEHLKDELDKYTAPLTWAQSRAVCKMRGLAYFAEVMELDAAIRAAREGESK